MSKRFQAEGGSAKVDGRGKRIFPPLSDIFSFYREIVPDETKLVTGDIAGRLCVLTTLYVWQL